MRIVPVVAFVLCSAIPAQGPAQSPAQHPAQHPAQPSAPKGATGKQGAQGTGAQGTDSTPPRVQSVQFDASGWPIVPEDSASRRAPAVPPAPVAEGATAPKPAAKPAKNGAPVAPPLVSGMQLGSPLLDLFQATRAPGAWKEIGGITVLWRVTTYGPNGETIGTRDFTHVADTAFAERDRLEHPDGRVFGRIGSQVFVERQGMPWPTLTEYAQHELMLFGTHLRFPWCFADASAFVVTGRDVEERNGERSARIVLERRPPAGSEIDGPEADPKPRDRFEIFYEASTGLPKEVVHRLAASRQTRRVRLDDWRDVDGVRMAYRRTYVDDAMHPTSLVEILRIERQRVSDRDFRLH